MTHEHSPSQTPSQRFAGDHQKFDPVRADEIDPLQLGAERFRPVTPPAEPSGRVRTLRSEHRARAQIRALLYAGRSFQTTTICDLSRSGAGVNGATGVLPGDLVALQLLDGRAIAGQVRWWLAGRCGIAFLEPLKDYENILNGPHNRLKPAAPHQGVSGGPAGGAHGRLPGVAPGAGPHQGEHPGRRIIDELSVCDPFVARTEDLSESMRHRYLRRYSPI